MSQLNYIYSEFKKDGFKPRREALAICFNEDLSILLHPEIRECLWFSQWQKKNLGKLITSYWFIDFSRWILI